MPTFPTLTQGPELQGFIEDIAIDPTIRSEMENGKVLTRARFTAVPKRWKCLLVGLTSTDKATLKAFEKDDVGYGGLAFDWENTEDGTTYSVKFAKPIKWTMEPPDKRVAAKRWRVEIELVEASPTS